MGKKDGKKGPDKSAQKGKASPREEKNAKYVTVDCPTCGGSGKRGIRDCNLCNGSGTIKALE